MRISILVYNARVTSPLNNLFIRRGYVYVDGGVVRRIEEGEPPVDYEAANLVIGGEGRLATPAYGVSHTHLTLYPLRYILPRDLHSNERASRLIREYVETLSEREAYMIALTALYELVMHGVVLVGAADAHVDAVERAMRELGVRGVIAVPMPGCPFSRRDWKEAYEALRERGGEQVKATLLACTDSDYELARRLGVEPYIHPPLGEGMQGGGLRLHVTRDGVYVPQPNAKPEGIVSVGLDTLLVNNPTAAALTMWSLGFSLREAYSAITVNVFKHLGFEGGVLQEGKPANIIVYDLTVPPGTPPASIDDALGLVILQNPRIESVIAWGQPIIDQGEHTLVERSKIEEGQRIAAKILEEYSQRLSNP